MPRLRGALGRDPEGAVPAARRDRRLGPPVSDDELRRRGADRARDRQVPGQWRAVQGREAGAVVGRRADRAGRGRGRVPRPPLEHGLGALPDRHAEPAGACRRGGGDLDDDALDPARQPRDRLQRRSRLCRPPGRCGSREQPCAARRAHCRRRAAGRGGLFRAPASPRTRSRPGSPAARWPARSARHPLHGQGYDFDVPLLAADFVTADTGTGPRPYRAGARRRRLGAGPGERAAGARHGRAGRRLSAARAAVCRACGVSPRRQAGRRRQGGDRGGRERRRAAGARHAGALLPAFLALEGAADLPQHAAMVHQHGGQRSAAEGA